MAVTKIRILLNVTLCGLVSVNMVLHPTDRLCASELGLDFQTGEGCLFFPLCPEWCKDGTTFLISGYWGSSLRVQRQ